MGTTQFSGSIWLLREPRLPKLPRLEAGCGAERWSGSRAKTNGSRQPGTTLATPTKVPKTLTEGGSALGHAGGRNGNAWSRPSFYAALSFFAPEPEAPKAGRRARPSTVAAPLQNLRMEEWRNGGMEGRTDRRTDGRPQRRPTDRPTDPRKALSVWLPHVGGASAEGRNGATAGHWDGRRGI